MRIGAKTQQLLLETLQNNLAPLKIWRYGLAPKVTLELNFSVIDISLLSLQLLYA